MVAGLQVYTGGIIFILMARMMSLEDFGLLSFGFSLGTLLSTCLDFGQSLMVMKDYLQGQFNKDKYVLNSLAQRLLFILIFCSAFISYLFAFYSDNWITIGLLFVAFAVLSAYVIYLQAVLRVQNRFRESAWSALTYALVITGVVGGYFFGELTMEIYAVQ